MPRSISAPRIVHALLSVTVLATASLFAGVSRAETFSIETMLPFDYGVTGIRADTGNNVVMTGGIGPPNMRQGPPAFIYKGTLDAVTSVTTITDPSLFLFTPSFGGNPVYGAMFYGPNTHRFNPTAIPEGNIRAVGAYLETGPDDFQKGMMYDGPLDGTGTWTSLQVPGADIGITTPHSTMGNLVVGNYNLLTSLTVGHSFVYDIVSQSYLRLDINGAEAATIYGIWQNGGEQSTSYTIVGGLVQTASSTGQGYIASYNAITHAVTGLALYSFADDGTIDTHFEGISAYNGGFSIAANAVSGGSSPAYAFIPTTGAVGSYVYGQASWTAVINTVNGSSATGDTVIDDRLMGIYADGIGARSFISSVPEIDPSCIASGLALVLGSLGLLERRRLWLFSA